MLHCPYCKGKHQSDCCPFYLKALAVTKTKKLNLSEKFQSSSPAPFVGRFGYPNINVGLLTPQERKDDVWLYDAPKYWASNSFQIPQIVDFRTGLLNSQEKINIKAQNKILEISQFVAMSDKPVELEVALKERPALRMNLDSHSAPTGPTAKLKKVELTSNPSIPTKIDKVVDDIDLKANEAITYLFKHGFDENFLSKLLSVGTLGIKTNRKLVPTRWSITATDDLLGKNIIKNIQDYSDADFQAFFGSYLGNYYLILFLPGVWGYELFEISLPSFQKEKVLDFSTDYENFNGRKEYAFDTSGGYYTVRLGILEKLLSIKKQASVLAIRVITDEYTLPLGVWVTREATRKALANKSISFSDDKLLLKYAELFLQKKFGLNISRILNESKLLKERRLQKRLSAFLTN